jgi:hypothetical protein
VLRWWNRWDAEVASILLCLLAAMWLWAVSGCQTAKDIGGSIGGAAAEWIACPTDLIDCGHVYMCAAVADNALGHVEICVNDDDAPEQVAEVEAVYGACDLTPRHQGLCWYRCEEGHGCNAFAGCWCP